VVAGGGQQELRRWRCACGFVALDLVSVFSDLHGGGGAANGMVAAGSERLPGQGRWRCGAVVAAGSGLGKTESSRGEWYCTVKSISAHCRDEIDKFDQLQHKMNSLKLFQNLTPFCGARHGGAILHGVKPFSIELPFRQRGTDGPHMS
jgi:hypothetical protein